LSVAFGDIDNDTFGDLIVGTTAGLPVQIYRSGGFRDFVAAALTVPDSSAHQGVALADFDNNGSLDIVLANAGVADTVYANNGAGTFSLMATLPGLTLSNDVAVGDFNNDGNMDIAIAATGGNPIYLGNGSGAFVLHATLGTSDSRGVAVGRMNGDIRDDIVFANVGTPSSLYTKNAGDGFNNQQNFNVGSAVSVVLAELLGTAIPDALDIAFGRVPTVLGDIPGNPVLENNGGGILTVRRTLGASPTNDILAGDVDGDSLADLVFVNATGVHQIWNRNGSNFVLHAEQIVADNALSGVLEELGMTDLGIPGGVDLAMGGTPQPGTAIFLNDSFGNLGRGDATAPTMVLNGLDPLEVKQGKAFIDPRATATDNIDGDISPSVIATGLVNTSVLGLYVVTYDVTDSAGNAAEPIKRIVSVVPGDGTGGGGNLSVITLLFLLTLLLASQSKPWSRAARSTNKNNT
jgi:hypothetical protein